MHLLRNCARPPVVWCLVVTNVSLYQSSGHGLLWQAQCVHARTLTMDRPLGASRRYLRPSPNLQRSYARIAVSELPQECASLRSDDVLELKP